MKAASTKPYLIRAIHEWCADNGYTPYLSVKVDAQTRVPQEFVRDGEIVLNIGAEATHRLALGNDLIEFSARFNGRSHEIIVPVDAVQGIFSKETTQGILFSATDESESRVTPPDGDAGNPERPAPSPQSGRKSRLQVVK